MTNKTPALSLFAAILCLLLVSPAQAGTVSVVGGFFSFSGTVSGNDAPAFINGTQVCPDTGCSTEFGPGHVTYATPQSSLDFYDTSYPGGPDNTHNLVEFTPAKDQSVSGPGVKFFLGTFTIANGIWTGDADFQFGLETLSNDDPNLNLRQFSGFLHMTLTSPNLPTNSPMQNADIYDLRDADGNILKLPSMRIYELADSPTGSNVGTIKLFGSIGSLDLTELSDPTGAAFLSDSHDPLAATPEPATLTMLTFGLGALALRRYRRR